MEPPIAGVPTFAQGRQETANGVARLQAVAHLFFANGPLPICCGRPDTSSAQPRATSCAGGCAADLGQAAGDPDGLFLVRGERLTGSSE